MSDAHKEEELVIKTPKQLVAAVVAGFLVPILIIVLLVKFVSSDNVSGVGSNPQTPEAIAPRIAPVAQQGYKFEDASTPKELMTGEAVYKAACAACHGAGVGGAPKFGDNGAWAPRIAQGYDTVFKHALEGFKGMPAKGGNADLDNVELARAVVYIANSSGGKFKEPEVKAAASASASAASPDASAK